MSVQSHESTPQRFPRCVIVPPATPERYRLSVVSLPLYSLALGVVLIAYVSVALLHTFNVSVGMISLTLLLLCLALLMVLSSVAVLIRVKRLQRFGRMELAGVAIVLFSINAGTGTFLVAWFFNFPDRPVFLLILILAGVIFWAIVSIRYLLRGREFANGPQGNY